MLKILFPLATALALAACSAQSQAPGPHADATGGLRFGALTFKPCSLSVPRVDAVEAQCATLAVPENHDAPAGRKIDLAIALVPAKGQAELDPIVMIAGGPGQSALESYPLVHAAFSDARRTRNVLLIDARGTGGSHPLKCEDAEGNSAVMEDGDSSPESARAFAVRCRDALSKTSDLRYYTTTDHIRDLDLVRDKLGVDRLNLVGVSYGTRVAQQYAKRYPQHTRSVVLDSVVPNSLALGQEHARNLDAALKLQFARCVADAACKHNLGDPAAQLQALRAHLLAGNLAPVRYRDPTTGTWRDEAPTFGHLAVLLRLYAYQPQAAAMLPLIVHDAAQGHYESLLAQSRSIYSDVSDAIMHGMQLSVSCTEDGDELSADQADKDSVLGTEFITFTKAQCDVWPKGRRDPDFRKPLTGDVPVLALSGEFDPVTPPRYGAEVIKSLPKGRLLILPGQGHSVLGIGCMPKLFAQFVESADVKALDASCLQRLKPTPPFAGNYGWEP
ncbi:MAG: alpha/beta fold hydrolase [Luteimonas sp.]|nr:alpha/beta fold hydrolase [Luteimonas sp.]